MHPIEKKTNKTSKMRLSKSIDWTGYDTHTHVYIYKDDYMNMCVCVILCHMKNDSTLDYIFLIGSFLIMFIFIIGLPKFTTLQCPEDPRAPSKLSAHISRSRGLLVASTMQVRASLTSELHNNQSGM